MNNKDRLALKSPHLELQTKHRKDRSQTVWTRWDKNSPWKHIHDPSWNATREYHIGPTPPPDQTKMCSMGGLQFPVPESVAPAIGTEIWIFGFDGDVSSFMWIGSLDNRAWLEHHFIHLTLQAAEQHSAAIRAANLQAVENAK